MKLKHNVPLIYTISALMWGRFFIPVLALFYIASQVSLPQLTIIFSVFALATLLLEIPSGVLADLLGKKKTLLISRALYIIEIFLIAFFNGFWIFLIAKIVSGFGVSLTSGTDNALLYDTLKKQGRKDQHKKISGTRVAITNISMAFVFIIGAFLFTINYKLPAIVSLPVVTAGFILTFFLQEPYNPSKKATFKNSFKHLKQGLKEFSKSPYIKFITFFSLLIFISVQIIFPLISSYLEIIKIPIILIGVASSLSAITIAYASKKAHKIETRLGEKNSLKLIQLLIIITLFLFTITIPYLGILYYLVLSFIWGFYLIVMNDYINHHIKSSNRATMLSIRNFFGHLGLFILFPIIGYMIGVKTMSFAFLILAIIILIGFILVGIYSKKLNKKT